MQFKKLATIFLVVMFLAGCAGWQEMTPEQRMDQQFRAAFMARAQLNDLIRSYQAYKTVLSSEKQLEIAEIMVPVFEKADFVLDQWETILLSDEPGYAQYEVWLQVKRELTMMMFQLGILEVEE